METSPFLTISKYKYTLTNFQQKPNKLMPNEPRDRIQNEEIHLKIETTLIDEKKRESHLTLFGHVHKRVIDALVRKSELIQVEGTKKDKERTRITLIVVVVIRTC